MLCVRLVMAAAMVVHMAEPKALVCPLRLARMGQGLIGLGIRPNLDSYVHTYQWVNEQQTYEANASEKEDHRVRRQVSSRDFSFGGRWGWNRALRKFQPKISAQHTQNTKAVQEVDENQHTKKANLGRGEGHRVRRQVSLPDPADSKIYKAVLESIREAEAIHEFQRTVLALRVKDEKAAQESNEERHMSGINRGSRVRRRVLTEEEESMRREAARKAVEEERAAQEAQWRSEIKKEYIGGSKNQWNGVWMALASVGKMVGCFVGIYLFAMGVAYCNGFRP